MRDVIRTMRASDYDAVLRLNEESVQVLSPMSAHHLAELHANSALHMIFGARERVSAFLLAFREHAFYDSVNYLWFAQRFKRFLYIDRVVVSAASRGQGIGTALYRHAFAHAADSAVPLMACEFDLEPPNPASQRFHLMFGFHEVGRQVVGSGKKTVSLQVANVSNL